MTATKELKWKQLTDEEKHAATTCGRLSNPEDFFYHRVLGELYACDDEQAWLATVPVEYSEHYPDEFFGYNNDQDASVSAACLIPITTDEGLRYESACKDYLGVDPKHVSDFTVGV